MRQKRETSGEIIDYDARQICCETMFMCCSASTGSPLVFCSCSSSSDEGCMSSGMSSQTFTPPFQEATSLERVGTVEKIKYNEAQNVNFNSHSWTNTNNILNVSGFGFIQHENSGLLIIYSKDYGEHVDTHP